MVTWESLLYGSIAGILFSIVIAFLWKFKLDRSMRKITGSHDKVITVYEEWEEFDLKLEIQMTEWTWELLNKEQWCNMRYQTWLSDLMYEATRNPLIAKQEVYWFGEKVGPKLDPKKIDLLMKSKLSES